MALHESALEELGLAPMWVRRGTAHGGDDSRGSPSLESVADADEAAPRAIAADAPFNVDLDADADAQRNLAVAEARATSATERDEGGAQRATRAATSGAPNAASFVDDSLRAGDQPVVSRADAPPEARQEPLERAPRPADADASASFADDDFAWFDDLPADPPSPAEARTDDPAQPGIDMLDWPALEARVSGCERCRLCEKRTNTVFGVGDREADWMLIGEAPGENEDRQGEPFVGQAGKLLDNMLRSLDLARGTNVYIANVIKCRPPGNRNPEPDEVARCEPFLQRQVALVKPKLIVALGRFAAQSLLKTEASISSLRGRVHEYQGVPVIVTYHPAYLLRSLGDKAKSWQDLCLARDTWRRADAQGDTAK